MKNLTKIALFIVFTLSVIMFTACENKNLFDGKGTAIININLEDDYGDVTVSCPSATKITSQQLKYKIQLNSLSQIDVIISSEGYESQILSFTTNDLKAREINKTVALTTKSIVLNLSVYNFSPTDLQGITITNDDGVIVGQPIIEEKSVKIMLSSVDGKILNIIKQGYYTNSFKLESGYFKNYSASIKIPLIKVDSGEVAMHIIADYGLPNHQYWQMELIRYQDNECIKSEKISKNNLFIFNNKTNYYIRFGNETLDQYSSYKLNQMIESGIVYKNYKLSQLIPESVFNDALNYYDSFYLKLTNEESINLNNVKAFVSDGSLIDGNNLQANKIYSNQKLTIFIYDDEKNLISLYSYNLNEKPVIELISGKFEEIFKTIKLVDVSNEIDMPFKGAKIELQKNGHSEDFLEKEGVIYDASTATVAFNLTQLIKDNGLDCKLFFNVEETHSDFFVSNSIISLDYYAFIASTETINFDKKTKIAIDFFVENQRIDASEVVESIDENFYEIVDGSYATKDECDVLNGDVIRLNFIEQFRQNLQSDGLQFNRRMFYYDEEKDLYRFDYYLEAFQKIELKLLVNNQPMEEYLSSSGATINYINVHSKSNSMHIENLEPIYIYINKKVQNSIFVYLLIVVNDKDYSLNSDYRIVESDFIKGKAEINLKTYF